MQFVIFHGVYGSPKANWFPYIKNQFEGIDQKVIAIQFPVDDWDEVTEAGPQVPPKNINLQNWLSVFKKQILPQLDKNNRICFIGHSLGCVFILHILNTFNISLDSAIFVSPFLEKLNTVWQIDHANKSFYKTDFNFKKLQNLLPISYILHSDNDPYVKMKYITRFIKKINGIPILVKGAKHMNAEAGFTKFPLVFELCKTRINAKDYIGR